MHTFDIKVLNLNPTSYLSSSAYSTWPVGGGYQSTYESEYVSGSSAPIVIKKPVVKGADSAFTGPLNLNIAPTAIQFVTEPMENDTVVFVYDSDNQDEQVTLRYLQNGVYLVSYKDERVRIVAPTGVASVKVVPTLDELFVVLNETPIRFSKASTSTVSFDLAPNGGIAYDKVICDAEVSVDEVVTREVKIVNGQPGIFMPMSRDKWYESKLVMADDMDAADDYRVTSRGLTLANTAVAFYSDLDNIEKSVDAENWEPVEALEFHGEDQVLYRSKDPDFALEYFDTDMTEFIIPGATTTVTGRIYKVGNNVGSIFSHDSYRVRGGSFKIESDNLFTVSILGKLPASIVDALEPQIDFDGSDLGSMHLYTFNVQNEFEISADDLVISGVGVNMNHEDLMNNLCKRVEMSYADEISDIAIGQSRNGENEYAILDLQWNV